MQHTNPRQLKRSLKGSGRASRAIRQIKTKAWYQ